MMVMDMQFGEMDDFDRVFDLLNEREAELNALLDACNQRDSTNRGIPALLIIDDLTGKEKGVFSSHVQDHGMGAQYADLALALAILVEKRGGDSHYPSICPAMSAIAEWRFSDAPFNAWEAESSGTGERKASDGA